MKPERVPIKGPVGKGDIDTDCDRDDEMIEPQEQYESYGEHRDLVAGDPTQDPTTLKALDSDHTPNHVRGFKSGKPNYGKHTSGDAEGLYGGDSR
jgi:hypothetical protein